MDVCRALRGATDDRLVLSDLKAAASLQFPANAHSSASKTQIKPVQMPSGFSTQIQYIETSKSAVYVVNVELNVF